MLEVHGVHGSPFVRKVLIALEIKGLEYKLAVQMPFTGSEEYQVFHVRYVVDSTGNYAIYRGSGPHNSYPRSHD